MSMDVTRARMVQFTGCSCEPGPSGDAGHWLVVGFTAFLRALVRSLSIIRPKVGRDGFIEEVISMKTTPQHSAVSIPVKILAVGANVLASALTTWTYNSSLP